MRVNRRKHIRVRKRLKAEYGDTELSHKGYLQDISVGGVFINSRRLFEVKTRLHLHIFTTQDHFYAEGQVVRVLRRPAKLSMVAENGMGIRFLGITEVIQLLVPPSQRAILTHEITCESRADCHRLLREQLSAGVIVVPLREPAPAINTLVEFGILLAFTPDAKRVQGAGRMIQILAQQEPKSAVLEVEGAMALRAEIEALLGVDEL